jgi:2-oxoglutarate ferredoxin oxidoreductase subunit alpha
VESALGQLARLVKEALFNMTVDKFETIYKPGVGITAEELVEAVMSAKKGGG